jgi:hypothetical protein
MDCVSQVGDMEAYVVATNAQEQQSGQPVDWLPPYIAAI